MRNDFCAFILTHGRPDRVFTLQTIRDRGYTGKVFLVVDDEDKTLPEYQKRYGDDVLVFSKPEIAKTFDEGDNFQDRRAIIYARNACFDLAREQGYSYFIELDDDYTGFYYRFDRDLQYASVPMWNLDGVWGEMTGFLEATPRLASVAMAQGGDHIGGAANVQMKKVGAKRKAMNTFICATDRPFQFFGRINEDVNVYTCGTRRGLLFLTISAVQVNQKQTQSNAGGMTDLYLDSGTYVKSFYSVMYAPSAVAIRDMGSSHRRLHHSIDWEATAPMILREEHRKANA